MIQHGDIVKTRAIEEEYYRISYGHLNEWQKKILYDVITTFAGRPPANKYLQFEVVKE